MLLAGSDGDEQPRIAREDIPHVIGRETSQWKGLAARHRLIAGMLAAVGAAEWLRGGGVGWAYADLTLVAFLLVATLWRMPRRWADPGLAGAGLIIAAAMLRTVTGTATLSCCWSVAREERLDRASLQLSRELGAAVNDARDLARRAAEAAS